MSIEEISVERLAERLHHYHHALETDFESHDRAERSWEELPNCDRTRLVTAARLALRDLSAEDGESGSRRRYFAKPGEAEWGC
jgi:hypothetical protein